MRLSAGGIIIKDKKILLIKRSTNSKTFPGFWSLPSGRGEKNETAEEVAIREVKEEIGLDFIPIKLFHSSIVGHAIEKLKTHRFLGTFSGIIKVQEEEVEGYAWYTYEETKKIEISFDYRDMLDKLHRELYL